MAVYRFRVAFDDNEDIQRDIEIKSNQSFEELHLIIQEAIKFDNKHAASFFVSDDLWRKNLEITLLKEDKEKDNRLMAETKISSCVDTPYQRFIYVYDKDVQWTLLVELIKILPDNPKVQYPVCVRSLGNAPKQYKQNLAAQGPISADLAMANMLSEDELDKEAYRHVLEPEMGLNDGDLDFATSEEGETEEDAEEMEHEEEHEEGNDDSFDTSTSTSDDY